MVRVTRVTVAMLRWRAVGWCESRPRLMESVSTTCTSGATGNGTTHAPTPGAVKLKAFGRGALGRLEYQL